MTTPEPTQRNCKPLPRGYIHTLNGGYISPFEPDMSKVTLADMARSLSFTARFNGHTHRFYSVLEHLMNCMNVAWIGRYHDNPPPRGLSLLLGLHDAAEAYLGDMARPVKREPELNDYRRTESHLLNEILEKYFNLAELDLDNGLMDYWSTVKEIDAGVCQTESVALKGIRLPDLPGVEPYNIYISPTIVPDFEDLRTQYLDRIIRLISTRP